MDKIREAQISEIKPPKSNYFITNEIARKISSLSMTTKVSHIAEKGKETTRFNIQFVDFDAEGTRVTRPANITTFEKVIHDAVISLYKTGNNYITAENIHRAICGMVNGEAVNPETAKKIHKSILKMQKTHIIIENQILVSNNKKEEEEVKVDYVGYMLPIEFVKIKTGGAIKGGYHVLNEPVLYTYADAQSFVRTIKIDFLQTKSLNNTHDVIVLRDYLISQYLYLTCGKDNKRKTKRSHNLLYSTIYEKLEVFKHNLSPDRYKHKTLDIRKKAKAILSDWKEKGLIQNWEEHSEGKSFRHITLKV